MKRTVFAGAAAILCLMGQAGAGFDSWTTETEQDPFSGGARVTVDYSSSLRSGIVFFCDATEDGVRIRAIPGYVYDTPMAGFGPKVEFAIDGEVMDGGYGKVGVVGDNLAAVDATLKGSSARNLLRAFAAAKKQIAVKDGMSDRPHLLNARGSTKAATALLDCMKRQPTYNLVD